MALPKILPAFLLISVWAFSAKATSGDPGLSVTFFQFLESVMVTCEATNLPESATIEVFKETNGIQSPLTYSSTTIKTDKGVAFWTFGQTDEGNYGCKSEVDGKTWSSSTVFIAYQEKAKITRWSSGVFRLWRGQDFKFICNATGVPVPNITWKKRRTDFETKDAVLELTSVTKEDSGIYDCYADNDIGKADRWEIDIDVVFYPITIQVDNPSVTIEHGYDKVIELKCVVDGGRIPRVTFWKETENGVIEIPNDRKKYLHNKNWTQGYGISNERWHILFILDVELADGGTYYCRAQNEQETQEKKFSVTVL